MRHRFIFREVGGCMLVTQGRETPADEEFNQYLEAMVDYTQENASPRVIVVTEGGAPSPEQRKRFDEVFKGVVPRMRFAIITDSTFARGVVHAFRLFYPHFEAFSSRELDRALRYLGISPARLPEIAAAVAGLKQELASSAGA